MINSNMIIGLLRSFTILFLICTKFHSLSIANSNETDHQALLHIKSRIQKDPFQVLDSWNDSTHFCNWKGITCGKKHKRVTILEIASLKLVGTLSPYVGNLTFLQNIYLYRNFFYGSIPPEIYKLFRLKYLNFADNTFQNQFPLNLTWFKNLRGIDLNNNKLNGRISDNLNALSNLQYLALGENNFIGNIPPSLGNISTLLALDLSSNNLSGKIPHELGKLFNLQELDLGNNKFIGNFPTEIYNISSIKTISIVENSLTGQYPHTLGLTLPNMIVFLSGLNNFSGSIPSTLSNASKLLRIDIGFNMLTGPIPRNLGRLKQLQLLLFDNNPLGINKDNDISFVTTFTNCTNLEVLYLSGMEIEGELPLEISNLSKKLTQISLADNHISGNLPGGIGDLVGLNVFSAYGNNLSGIIPLSIGNLREMKQIYLYENKFTGEIPSSIGDIPGLLILSLHQNMLTGRIPLSLSNLTRLEALDLSQNQLNGSLPKEVFNMTSLSIALDLGKNKFIGSLPSEVGNLKNLVELSISENDLSGEIPLSIGGCLMLVNLEMEGNFLIGKIPPSLGKLKSIELMDLSRNKLSGEIPITLESLVFISFLNLSFNVLEGEVPSNGVFVNSSAFSVMGNEKLCGGIKSLNLPICPPIESKKHKELSTHIIIILGFCVILALFFLFGTAYTICRRRKSRAIPSLTSPYDKKILKISYAEILNSTNGFSSENLIGDGKYGSVYRGVLKPDEKIVAVKVLKLHLKGAYKSFLAECEALKNIRHRNLVKIITSCSSIDFKGNDFMALILEFVPNGSLEEWLHQNPYDQLNGKKLNLLERINIAIDIATALDYLHNHSGNPIVHCDIKPSNILLGDDLHGLVSDSGLAKFLPTVKDISLDIESNSIGIRGTIGYVAPEYGMGGGESIKGDIYSYGILLLEMFTGKRPTDVMFTEDFTLHKYVRTTLHNRVTKIIDPRLLTVEDIEEEESSYTSTRIESCCSMIFHVGISCSSEMPNDRMDIKDALNKLEHARNEI